jgi:hypothetical protein
LLGARIVVLLKEISEPPMLPIHTKLEDEARGGATRLEVEYGMALIEYMLEVARGFYDNTISLEGRTNKTAIVLVEVWWWLHRKADYMIKADNDRRLNCTRVPGEVLSVIVRFCRMRMSGVTESFSTTWPMPP